MSEMLTLYSERPRISENLNKEIYCWLLKQKKSCLQLLAQVTERKKEGGGVKWSRMEKKRKKCFTILFMILSSKSELLKCSQDLS